ncbi:hydroxyacylglutathione hydrolase, partial [Haematococcus lacustris]
MALQVERVPCLSDNYVWLVHEPLSKLTAVVDPAEVQPVVAALKSKGWQLSHIWNTHHHWDHTGGNKQLKQLFPDIQVLGPAADKARIPAIDVAVADGGTFQFGGVEVRVFDTPGHTRGHIVFWAPQASALFSGDTLFALGCGRLFEGSPAQMWHSLSKLLPLPDETQVFCAHEYTQNNARFAVSVDPGNAVLRLRKDEIDKLRAQGLPTVPSSLGEEKATNPFLRPHDAGIRSCLGVGPEASDVEVFTRLRHAKDNFH